MLGCLVQAFKQYIKFLLHGVGQCGLNISIFKNNMLLSLRLSMAKKMKQHEQLFNLLYFILIKEKVSDKC